MELVKEKVGTIGVDGSILVPKKEIEPSTLIPEYQAFNELTYSLPYELMRAKKDEVNFLKTSCLAYLNNVFSFTIPENISQRIGQEPNPYVWCDIVAASFNDHISKGENKRLDFLRLIHYSSISSEEASVLKDFATLVDIEIMILAEDDPIKKELFEKLLPSFASIVVPGDSDGMRKNNPALYSFLSEKFKERNGSEFLALVDDQEKNLNALIDALGQKGVGFYRKDVLNFFDLFRYVYNFAIICNPMCGEISPIEGYTQYVKTK